MSDLNWCVCGKQTIDEALYCSRACKSAETTQFTATSSPYMSPTFTQLHYNLHHPASECMRDLVLSPDGRLLPRKSQSSGGFTMTVSYNPRTSSPFSQPVEMLGNLAETHFALTFTNRSRRVCATVWAIDVKSARRMLITVRRKHATNGECLQIRCTCGKATKEGHLYCSDPCRVNDCIPPPLPSATISPRGLGINLPHTGHLNLCDDTLTPTLLSSFPSYDSALSSAASSFREGITGIRSPARGASPPLSQHIEKTSLLTHAVESKPVHRLSKSSPASIKDFYAAVSFNNRKKRS
ncbi:hypothetical protein BC830DRAFT_1079896 [Chytriomyces sp. MP71]|nr:hypothetical protein BC830DRAFT_1079896 [Chytriomyces sp. MP71]